MRAPPGQRACGGLRAVADQVARIGAAHGALDDRRRRRTAPDPAPHAIIVRRQRKAPWDTSRTHVLDTMNGCPAAGMAVELHRLGAGGGLVKAFALNADGRWATGPLLDAAAMARAATGSCSRSPRISARAACNCRIRRSSTSSSSTSASPTRPATTTCRCSSAPGRIPPTAAADASGVHAIPYLLDWANLLLRWAHLGHRDRLDRLVVLLRLPRQQPDPAGRRRPCARASAANCGRCTAAASTTRRSTPSRRRSCRRTCTGSIWESYSTWLTGFALFTVSTCERRHVPDRHVGDGLVARARRSSSRSPSSPRSGSSTTRSAASSAERENGDLIVGALVLVAGRAWLPGWPATCSPAAPRSCSSARCWRRR